MIYDNSTKHTRELEPNEEEEMKADLNRKYGDDEDE